MNKKSNKKPILQRNIQRNKQFYKSDTRKTFFQRLLYIGLGIIPLIIVWESKGLERFIGLAGFLFSLYNLIIISSLTELFRNIFSRGNSQKTT